MATVYIHIGAPKTATSTLQAVLSKNQAKLLKQGVLYPASCRQASAHHPLICDLMHKHQGQAMADMWYGDVERGTAWSALASEMEAQGPGLRAVVVSSELFFGQARHLEDMLEDVLGYLQGHRIEVVAYLRRQDQMYASFYNQDIKGARQWCHNAYRFYETHQIFQRDYHSLLSAWAEALGRRNVLVRPFEPQQWTDGDIVADFCRTTGLPPLNAGNLESNEGLGPNQLYIKRCLNRVGYAKSLNDPVLGLLTRLCPESPARDCVYVHKRLYRKYRREWLQTNQRIARDFLHGDALFANPIPEATALEPYRVEDAVLAAYAGAVADSFSRGRQRELRPLFARGTLLMIAERDLWQALDAGQAGRLLEWL